VFLEDIVILQKPSTFAFLPADSIPLLLLCMILCYCLYYCSVHILDRLQGFLTVWREGVKNIVFVPAERKKIEISFFLSIISLPFFLSTKFQTFLDTLFFELLSCLFSTICKLWLVFNSIFVIV